MSTERSNLWCQTRHIILVFKQPSRGYESILLRATWWAAAVLAFRVLPFYGAQFYNASSPEPVSQRRSPSIACAMEERWKEKLTATVMWVMDCVWAELEASSVHEHHHFVLLRLGWVPLRLSPFAAVPLLWRILPVRRTCVLVATDVKSKQSQHQYRFSQCQCTQIDSWCEGGSTLITPATCTSKVQHVPHHSLLRRRRIREHVSMLFAVLPDSST